MLSTTCALALFALVSLASASPAASSADPAPDSALRKANFWFSFGDSYTTTGFMPNGTIPTPGNPLGNPPFPGRTTTGGTDWIDVDTVMFNKSLILTYNYAFGGATINSTLVPPSSPTIPSFIEQADQFFSTVGNKPATAPWTSRNALFSVWIGINDIGKSYQLGGDRQAFSDTLMDSYFTVVQKLFDVGARNFLFINVPPVDRSPTMIAQGAALQALEKPVILGYNAKLARRVAEFRRTHRGVRTFEWDSHAVFNTILDDPTRFGFVDNATAFGGPNDFWGNNFHPSSAAHTIFGRDVAQVLAHTIW